MSAQIDWLPPIDGWTNDDWATPWELVRALELEFGPFDLDPCATEGVQKAPSYYTKEQDGLSLPWFGRVFVNPPFTRKVEFLQRAYEATQEGEADLVVCLVPANMAKAWTHKWILGKAEVRFLRRVDFRAIGKDATTSPRDGCLLAIYRASPGGNA